MESGERETVELVTRHYYAWDGAANQLGWDDAHQLEVLKGKFSAVHGAGSPNEAIMSLSYVGLEAAASYAKGLVTLYEKLSIEDSVGLQAVRLLTGDEKVDEWFSAIEALEKVEVKKILDAVAQVSQVQNPEDLRKYVKWYEGELIQAGLLDLPF